MIEGWMITLIAVFAIPASLSTLNRNEGLFDIDILLVSSACVMIYAIYIGLFPSYTLVLPILIYGLIMFRPGGGE